MSEAEHVDRATYRRIRGVVNTAIAEAMQGRSFANAVQLQKARRMARMAAFTVAAVLDARRQEAERIETEAHAKSITDAFSGLDNRRGYNLRVYELFKHACHHRIPIALVNLDLNDIDIVNQTKGRAEGDRWILTTAHILATNCSLRPARWGGDEFRALLPHFDEAQLRGWWNNMQDGFDSSGIHISAGASLCNPRRWPGGDDIEETISSVEEVADEALYDAKLASKEQGRSMLSYVLCSRS